MLIKPNTLRKLCQFNTPKTLCKRYFAIEVPLKLSYATYENTQSTDSNAAPLIVTHGLFGSKTNWNSLCKVYQQKTSPQRKIIAVDARNHGESPHSEDHNYAVMVADLKGLIDDLGLKKVALMAHSMGGRTVMLFALTYPELVERLIVVDISPTVTSSSLSAMPRLFEVLNRVELPKDLPMSRGRAHVDSQMAVSIHNKDIRAFLLTNLVRNADGSYKWRINVPSLLKNFQNVKALTDIQDLQYEGPTLFVGGGDSDYLPKSDFPKIQKLFPNAELKYIEGAGHWLHSEKPNEFLQITLEFLNRGVSTN